MTMPMKKQLEQRIVKAAVKAVASVPGTVRIVVDNGEDEIDFAPDDTDAIMAEVNDLDEAFVVAVDAKGLGLGWVRPVFGNEPYEVLADWTTSLEKLEAWKSVESAQASAETMCN